MEDIRSKGRAQHEITRAVSLLDENGNLTEPGYARSLLPVYDRSKVKGGLLRLKEWDYYYIGNDKFGVALTIADNSYMGLDSFSFLWFGTSPADASKGSADAERYGSEPWEITKSPMRILTRGKTNLPETSEEGVTRIVGKNYFLKFEVTKSANKTKAGYATDAGMTVETAAYTKNTVRRLTGHIENFDGDKPLEVAVMLTDEPRDSMVICTPFDKTGHFYFNQKINCMAASGYVRIGDERFEFDPSESIGLLDWGRGVWTYQNTWYWGSASGHVDGVPFGFNIGYGFGDTSAASENMLFYNGRAHKLSEVTFNIPLGADGTESYMEPWTFTSDDGRFEMDFVPVIDRAADTDFKVLRSNQHQVFGRFTGRAMLDDGTKVNVRDLFGFAEKVHNKW